MIKFIGDFHLLQHRSELNFQKQLCSQTSVQKAAELSANMIEEAAITVWKETFVFFLFVNSYTNTYAFYSYTPYTYIHIRLL